jgi:hypothetical protein
MKLRCYSVSIGEFSKLPLAEGVFLVRLANAANDLRHPQPLTIREAREWPPLIRVTIRWNRRQAMMSEPAETMAIADNTNWIR